MNKPMQLYRLIPDEVPVKWVLELAEKHKAHASESVQNLAQVMMMMWRTAVYEARRLCAEDIIKSRSETERGHEQYADGREEQAHELDVKLAVMLVMNVGTTQ